MDYARTRNFENGAVTKLGPYVSRGVISTRQIYEHIRAQEIPWGRVEKLVQELAWRDHWQHVWIARGNDIYTDLKYPQPDTKNHRIPTAVIEARTGIDAVDKAIRELYATGYMHNHMRMYVAAICCNIAKCHWSLPSKWLYAHLLDGDLASNNLSWQWVAGSNANKKYYANQENINKYFQSNQKGTFLDIEYREFHKLAVPESLQNLSDLSLNTDLSAIDSCTPEPKKQTLIYNYYNLDPHWHEEEVAQRIMLLEPSAFSEYSISRKCLDFAIELAQNINGIKFFVGEFDALSRIVEPEYIRYKEHPHNRHYQGREEPRQWLTAVTGAHSSFFGFWKKCKNQLQW